MKLCSNPGVNHQHWATHIRHTPFCSCPTLPTTTPIQPRREAARAKHFPNHRKRNQRTTTMNVEQRRRAPCEASKIKMLPNRQHFVVKILFWPSYLASWSLFVPCSIPMQSRRGRVRLPVQRPRSASTRIQARAWSLWLPRPGHLVNSRATSPRRMCTIFAPTNCVVSYWSWWARCSPAWTCSSSCDPSHWGRTMNCGQAFWLHNRRSVSIRCKLSCKVFTVLCPCCRGILLHAHHRGACTQSDSAPAGVVAFDHGVVTTADHVRLHLHDRDCVQFDTDTGPVHHQFHEHHLWRGHCRLCVFRHPGERAQPLPDTVHLLTHKHCGSSKCSTMMTKNQSFIVDKTKRSERIEIHNNNNQISFYKKKWK